MECAELGENGRDGFGHIAFNVDDVYAACEVLEAKGCTFKKKPDEGRMKGIFSVQSSVFRTRVLAVHIYSCGANPLTVLSATLHSGPNVRASVHAHSRQHCALAPHLHVRGLWLNPPRHERVGVCVRPRWILGRDCQARRR